MIGNIRGQRVELERPCIEFVQPEGVFGDVRNSVRHIARRALEKTLGRRLKGQKGDEICCHACNNAMCIEPTHLYAGTYSDNTQDSLNVGTHSWSSSEVQSKAAQDRVARGTHNWLSPERRREPTVSVAPKKPRGVGGLVQRKYIEAGTHPFQDSEWKHRALRKRWAKWRRDHGRPPKPGDDAVLGAA